jgi:uncharacterized glyoxalase superfamily protein PhnB
MEDIRFRYTILYVEDVSETLTFFENAFGFKRALLHESGDYGELDTGATKLSFSSIRLMTDIGKNPSRPDSSSPVFEIAFEVEDVASALSKALAAGATLVQDTEQMPWGQTTAYVSDSNGFLIELCTPVATQP